MKKINLLMAFLMVVFSLNIARATFINVNLLESNGEYITSGASLMYFDTVWKSDAIDNGDGTWIVLTNHPAILYEMTYNGSVQQIGPLSTSIYTIVFQTVRTSVSLSSSSGAWLNGGIARYKQLNDWTYIGTTGAGGLTPMDGFSPSVELLPGVFYFECEYNDGFQQLGPVVVFGQSMNVEFKTTKVIFEGPGAKEYAMNKWRSFTGAIELLPGMYYFRIDGKMLGPYAVSGNEFYRALIDVELHHSNGQVVKTGGSLRYFDLQWNTDAISNDDGSWSVVSASPLAYFEMTYNHSKQQIGPVTLSVAAPIIVFPTTLVTIRLEDCNNHGFREGMPRFFQQSWIDLPHTNEKGISTVELLAGVYFFDMDFNMSRQQKGPVTVEGISHTIVFTTTDVTVLFNGQVDFYNYGWNKFYGRLDLLPGEYFFRVDGVEVGPYNISGCEFDKSLVMISLLNHQGHALAGGTVRYLSGTNWMKLGTTGATGKVLSLVDPTKMTIEITYNNVSKKVSVHNAMDYTFRTSLVRINLKDQQGNLIHELNAGAASVFSPTMGRWNKLGTTGENGSISVELLPLAGYQFSMTCGKHILPVVQKTVPYNTTLDIDFIYPPFKSMEVPAYIDNPIAIVYPNPFADRLNVEFSMKKSGMLEISCYSINGLKVFELLKGEMPSGNHNMQWNMDLSPGTYFLRVISEDHVWTRKIIKQ